MNVGIWDSQIGPGLKTQNVIGMSLSLEATGRGASQAEYTERGGSESRARARLLHTTPVSGSPRKTSKRETAGRFDVVETVGTSVFRKKQVASGVTKEEVRCNQRALL